MKKKKFKLMEIENILPEELEDEKFVENLKAGLLLALQEKGMITRQELEQCLRADEKKFSWR